ncbi:hypothetical protein ABIE09_004707 [Lysobacter enzymogenes]|uniref:hypothetical protein n=1 Tax=Lysobacter enzymogenes TaxID=69 RepID=UPI00089D996F|nr:hypothetical protein [Lysobacter enzymogenes]SDX97855.1 hypothetical protein SAMN05421681_109237 [Lysobacter enzymogenes]
MTRTTRWMALCAFAFGLSFASVAFAACNSRCFETCKDNAIANCVASGGGDRCYTDATYGRCYRQCGCIIP